MCRAIESDRPDALFQDPFARMLAGDKGRQIIQAIGETASTGWTVAVRTAMIDELLLSCIHEAGIDTVINLAAGYDTRPYRLALPPALRWIEVDFPALLADKQQKLSQVSPQCLLEQVGLDVMQPQDRAAFLSQVNSVSNRTLILTEGLLVYFSPEQVASLASEFHDLPCVCYWMSDVVSPIAAKLVQSRWRTCVDRTIEFKFAPQQPRDFFQQYGWRVSEFRSLWQESRRLRRGTRIGWLLGHLPILSDGIILCQK